MHFLKTLQRFVIAKMFIARQVRTKEKHNTHGSKMPDQERASAPWLQIPFIHRQLHRHRARVSPVDSAFR
jgi:hypothetical protein